MELSITGPDLREIIEEVEGQYGVKFNKERNSRDGNCGYIVLKADCDGEMIKRVHDHLTDRLSDANATVIMTDVAVLAQVAVSSTKPYYYPQ
jgi:hypothetical protein